MRIEKVKNVFAVVGAVFVGFVVLAFVVAALTGAKRGDSVAVVRLEGVIIDSTEISRELKALGERVDIKAVVVRINSPGGAVGPSQELHGEILRLRKLKPVVVSMGTVAASGGYYAAVAANKIVANPGTITGSIGVLVEFMNAQELLGKVGLKGYVIKSGKFKDTGSPFRKMEPEETEFFQSVIDEVSGQFTKAVADGRGMDVEAVKKLADGRVFTGARAKELGLVDALGDLSDAIDLGASLSGIEGKPNVVYIEKKGFNLLKAVLGDAPSDITELFSGLRVMYMMTAPGR